MSFQLISLSRGWTIIESWFSLDSQWCSISSVYFICQWFAWAPPMNVRTAYEYAWCPRNIQYPIFQYPLFTIQYSMFIVQYLAFILQYSLFILYSILFVQYSIFIIRSSIYNIHYSISISHHSIVNVHCSIFNIHYSVFIVQ